VANVAPGDRVASGISNGYGSYAEYYAMPAWHLFNLADAIDFPTAAATMQQGMTAHYLARSVHAITPGDTVLVHAAAGGTGLLLVQIAKMFGARVLGTASTERKAALIVEAGADAAINYVAGDFVSEVKKLTAGTGVDVVYDSVGKATFERNLEVVAPLGKLVIFGQASGPVPPFDTAVLNAKGSLSLWRPSLTHYVANAADVQRRAGELFEWIAAGKLRVKLGGVFPLSQAADAHRALEGRQSVGKILLLP
jgi:NADPH2:quinone reductase